MAMCNLIEKNKEKCYKFTLNFLYYLEPGYIMNNIKYANMSFSMNRENLIPQILSALQYMITLPCLSAIFSVANNLGEVLRFRGTTRLCKKRVY